jgi:HEAT repeat protein
MGENKMNNRFEYMEKCIAAGQANDAESFNMLLAALNDADWQIRYAAVVAIGDRKNPAAVNALVKILQDENTAPIYTQDADYGGAPAGSPYANEPNLPAGTTDETRDAWHRRGRIKQATIIAIGSIGIADPKALDLLHDYAVNQKEDYMVRAASCQTLGILASPASKPYLEKAVNDNETCTMMEAVRALRRVKREI